MMAEYKEAVAAGLRRMKTPPDAFIYCGDEMFGKKLILGIPVLHSALVTNTFADNDNPFIPLWFDEGEYILQRQAFERGYNDGY